jgi:glycine/D-amino acid oxidase-like deaminating enzyme
MEGRERLVQSLTKIYHGKFEIVRQMVGVRPTVNDRRPLIGLLPGTLSQYIFNGMGTKGTSLAPFWAEQLLLHITQGMTLPEDVHPDRYIP